MNQLTLELLPAVGAARKRDRDTSKAAALSLDPTALERVVLDAVVSLGGATSEQVADYLRIERVTISPRFKPLEKKGWLVATDERRIGKSGRSSIVWRALK